MYYRLFAKYYKEQFETMWGMVTDKIHQAIYKDAQRRTLIVKKSGSDVEGFLGELFIENFDGYPDEWWKMDDFEREFERTASRAYGKAASSAFTDIGISIKIGIDDPKVKQFIQSRRNFIKGLPEDGFNRFKKMFEDLYYKKGYNPLYVASKLKKEGLWDEYYKNRSRTIARTEAKIAQGTARYTEYKNAGFKEKDWLSAGDSLVRSSHADNDSIGWIPMDKPFPNGQMYPGDTNAPVKEFINCRCALRSRPGKKKPSKRREESVTVLPRRRPPTKKISKKVFIRKITLLQGRTPARYKEAMIWEVDNSDIPMEHLEGLVEIVIENKHIIQDPMGTNVAGYYIRPLSTIHVGTGAFDEWSGTILHEIGHHAMDHYLSVMELHEWEKYSARTPKGSRVTEYAGKNVLEHFAETYEHYASGGTKRAYLKTKEPEAYAFMRKLFVEVKRR